MQDLFHARTAAALGGVKDVERILIFKQRKPQPDQFTVGQRLNTYMQSLAGENNV